MTARTVIGVDGGGTKSDVIVAASTGEVLGWARTGAANWEYVGLETMATTIGGAIAEALEIAGRRPVDVDASAFCLAGVDWPSDRDRLAPHLDALGLGGARLVTNDAFAALRAGASRGTGCVSIAGTGGVSAGRNSQGDEYRTMGISWGEGKGAWGLVEAALHAIAAADHGSLPSTSMANAFVQRSGADSVPQMFELYSRSGANIGTDYAPLVTDAARRGDAAAIDVCAAAGAQHGRDVAAVAARLGMAGEPFDLVLAGGLHLNAGKVFGDAFVDAVSSRTSTAVRRRLTTPPVAGAALLALELLGTETTDIFDAVTAAAGSIPPEAATT